MAADVDMGTMILAEIVVSSNADPNIGFKFQVSHLEPLGKILRTT
jgi:hypothetical protein